MQVRSAFEHAYHILTQNMISPGMSRAPSLLSTIIQVDEEILGYR